MSAPFQRDPVRPFEDIVSAVAELESHLTSARMPTAARVRLLAQIGTLYRTSPEPSRAIPYFEEAITLSRAHNLRQDEAVNTLRLAVAYQYAGRVEDAFAAFKAALMLCAQRRTHLDTLYQHWGKFLVEQDNPREAIPYFEQALLMRINKGDDALTQSTREALESARQRSLPSSGPTYILSDET